jgi:hypothetical protein
LFSVKKREREKERKREREKERKREREKERKREREKERKRENGAKITYTPLFRCHLGYSCPELG